MSGKYLDVLAPLRSSGAPGVAGGFVVAMAVWEASRALIEGIVGSWLSRLDLSNETGSFRLDLGTTVVMLLAGAVALLLVMILTKIANRG